MNRVSKRPSGKKPQPASKSKFETAQEQFWAGSFGDSYISRNEQDELVARNLSMFSKILRRAEKIKSAIELGANIGLNMRTLHALIPGIKLTGIEINASAVERLRKIKGVEVRHESILTFRPRAKHDLSFTLGVLIHIAPEKLDRAYKALYDNSSKYICVAEYYNPTPVAVSYRGHEDRLFKRDFAGDLLDKYRDLKLVDYGFVYRRDANFRQDDLTWFLLEKK